MHSLDGGLDSVRSSLPINPWLISLSDLELLAYHVGGQRKIRWIRDGACPSLVIRSSHGKVVGLDRGTISEKIQNEFELLTADINAIRQTNGVLPMIRAAAYYHLRFEQIHPLRDCNGRVGRVLLAAQCADACRLPIDVIYKDIEASGRFYRQVFAVDNDAHKFELLLDLLSRIIGMVLDPESLVLPKPLANAFPDLTPLPALTEIRSPRDEHGRLLYEASMIKVL